MALPTRVLARPQVHRALVQLFVDLPDGLEMGGVGQLKMIRLANAVPSGYLFSSGDETAVSYAPPSRMKMQISLVGHLRG